MPVVSKERIRVPTDKMIHILFHEQAVCRNVTRMEKLLLDLCWLYSHGALPFPSWVRDDVSTG